MRQYLDLVQEVMSRGTRKPNRTGVDTISTFGYYYEHDMRDGFPLLTTKHVEWKNILIENLWFLSGARDLGFLHKHGCKFWDSWERPDGTVPSPYGYFWRRYPTKEPHFDSRLARVVCEQSHIDQIRFILIELKRNPMSRRTHVSAWEPSNAQASSLPPCHCFWGLNVQNYTDGTQNLCLSLYQRSCDVALGVPYNLAGYAFLLQLFAQILGMEPGKFGHFLVDAHIYTKSMDGSNEEFDHYDKLFEQCKRQPRALPRLIIDPSIHSLDDVDRIIAADLSTQQLLEMFRIEDYDPHPKISFKAAI